MKANKENQCSSCVWGKSTGLKYHCIFPSCVKHQIKYHTNLWVKQGDKWQRLKGGVEIIDEALQLQAYRFLKPGSEVKIDSTHYFIEGRLPLVDLDVGFARYSLRRRGD